MLPILSPSTQKILLYLEERHKTVRVITSNEKEFEKDTGIKFRTVRRALRRLEYMGFISRFKRWRKPTYIVVQKGLSEMPPARKPDKTLKKYRKARY